MIVEEAKKPTSSGVGWVAIAAGLVAAAGVAALVLHSFSTVAASAPHPALLFDDDGEDADDEDDDIVEARHVPELSPKEKVRRKSKHLAELLEHVPRSPSRAEQLEDPLRDVRVHVAERAFNRARRSSLALSNTLENSKDEVFIASALSAAAAIATSSSSSSSTHPSGSQQPVELTDAQKEWGRTRRRSSSEGHSSQQQMQRRPSEDLKAWKRAQTAEAAVRAALEHEARLETAAPTAEVEEEVEAGVAAVEHDDEFMNKCDEAAAAASKEAAETIAAAAAEDDGAVVDVSIGTFFEDDENDVEAVEGEAEDAAGVDDTPLEEDAAAFEDEGDAVAMEGEAEDATRVDDTPLEEDALPTTPPRRGSRRGTVSNRVAFFESLSPGRCTERESGARVDSMEGEGSEDADKALVAKVAAAVHAVPSRTAAADGGDPEGREGKMVLVAKLLELSLITEADAAAAKLRISTATAATEVATSTFTEAIETPIAGEEEEDNAATTVADAAEAVTTEEDSARAPTENAEWVGTATKRELVAFLQACGSDDDLAAVKVPRSAKSMSKKRLKKLKAGQLRAAALTLL